MLRTRLLIVAVFAAIATLASATSAGAFGQLGAINPVGGGPNDETYQLDSPSTIARSVDGTFYVVDQDNSRVVHLTADGKFISAFGGPIGENRGTRVPVSLALIPNGGGDDVLVSSATDGIKRFDSDGNFIAKFGASIGGAYLAYDPSCGELYVSEPQARQVQRFALGDNPATAGTTENFGDLLETFGGGATSYPPAAGQLWSPRGIDVDSTGRVFVAEASNFRVVSYKWTGNCAARTHAYDKYLGNNNSGSPALMLAPTGVAVDRSLWPNRIYVTQTYQDNIVQAFVGDSSGEPNASLPYYDIVSRWGTSVPYLGVPGSGLDDLSYPSSIALSGGNGWVAESGNNRIHAYSGVSTSNLVSPPTTTGLWGENPEQDGYFRDAGAMVAARDGSVWVLDRAKYRVQHFSPKGELISAFGEYGTTEEHQFASAPTGIALTPTGEVLVSGAVQGGIQRFDTSGNHLGLITWTPLTAGTASPGAIDVNASGDIFVWDYQDTKVVKLSPDGTVIARFGSNGSNPDDDSLAVGTSIAASADGRTVFVLDQPYNRIKKFTSTDGATYTFAAVSNSPLSGSGDLQLSVPTAIALHPDEVQLVVADGANNRVKRLSAADFSYLDQFGTYGFGSDNLISPGGLDYDRWGNLWLSDTGNDRVKRFGDAPQVAIAPVATSDASSAVLNFESTDPAADCDRTSGATVALAVGANSFSVSCTNAQGVGSATVVITRTAPAAPPVPTPVDPTIKFPKKLKLSSKNKLAFTATCPDGCKVTGKVKIGRSNGAVKGAALGARPAAQKVSLAVPNKLAKKIRVALQQNKKVTLSVTVQSYTAKQGKTGSAKLKK